MSFDVTSLHRGLDSRFYVLDDRGHSHEVFEMFSPEEWDDPRAFAMAGIRGYDPMTAKELETEEAQNKCLDDPNFIIEEKFDGTRALVYFMSQQDYHTKTDMGFCRVFSRRISKKTGFYVENTDSLPQIREVDVPELAGTILDGEMFIDGKPFKEVSSTLNCSWFNALDRQIEKGFVTFHAFDILFYKGVDLRRMPLHRRKEYLRYAIEEAHCDYIKEVMYHLCGSSFDMTMKEALLSRNITTEEGEEALYAFVRDHQNSFPNLFNYYDDGKAPFTPRAYYELVVASGGEGVMVKPKDGKYSHKRGWEYSKIKAFLTRDLIVMGFSEPTREYTGKDVRRWAYWVEKATNKRMIGNYYGNSAYLPVTRHYYCNQVGNLLLGVLISKEDYEKIAPSKRGDAYPPSAFIPEFEDSDLLLMQVCETSGFDDDTRAMFTQNRERLVGTVVEVKANGLFHDSGKFRHPRFLRMRPDKSPEQCTWDDHVGASEVTV